MLFWKNDISGIEGYTNSDLVGSQIDKRYTLGYFAFIKGNLVTWRTKKHKVMAMSSAKAEFCCMTHGLYELLWIRSVLKEL